MTASGSHADMHRCMLESGMPKTIQIRDLDDEVYRSLATRAAEAGLSVPELIRVEITRIAGRPSMTDWLDRTRRRSSALSSTETLAALDEIRGEWPDARR